MQTVNESSTNTFSDVIEAMWCNMAIPQLQDWKLSKVGLQRALIPIRLSLVLNLQWSGPDLNGLTWKAMIASPIFMDIEQRNSLNVLPRGAGSMAIRMARFAPMLQLHSDDQPCARPTAGKLNRIRSLTWKHSRQCGLWYYLTVRKVAMAIHLSEMKMETMSGGVNWPRIWTGTSISKLKMLSLGTTARFIDKL